MQESQMSFTKWEEWPAEDREEFLRWTEVLNAIVTRKRPPNSDRQRQFLLEISGRVPVTLKAARMWWAWCDFRQGDGRPVEYSEWSYDSRTKYEYPKHDPDSWR